MPIEFPAGFRSPAAAELVEQKQNLKSLAPQDQAEDHAQIPDSLRSRNRMLEQIANLKARAAGDRKQMAYRLPIAAHAPAVPTLQDLYHPRDPALNRLQYFFAACETEKPSIAGIKALPENRQAFYFTRHIGKRGRDLFSDKPIEGDDCKAGTLKTSPYLKSQGQGVRAIRGEAATATIDDYMDVTTSAGHFIHRLHDHVLNQLDPAFIASGGKVHLVRPTRDHYASDATLNFFTFCTQTELTASLNAHEAETAKAEDRPAIVFTDHKTCVGLSRTARTEASPIGRLVQQPYFTTDDIEPGDKVVIADDHVQAGGSLLAMASALKDAGAHILGAVTLTAHPYSATLAMNEQVSNRLRAVLAAWDPEGKVLRTLSEMGLPRDTLTNAEAMILIAYATGPQAADHAANSVASFRNMERNLTQNFRVMEGEHDSLDPILLQKPKSPEEIVDELLATATQTRLMVDATPVARVEVLDWDCFIVNEKLANYQLMANALFIAADNHAQTHPVIGQIAEAVRPYVDSQIDGQLNTHRYTDGMPLMCMGKEAFVKYGVANPSLWKKHVPIDLLDKLHTIAPHITIAGPEAKQIINILQVEFRRQYKSFTRPAIPAEVARRQTKTARNATLPFDNVALEFMLGAEDFMNRQRTPDARLILISNKGDNDLHNEVNKLGIAHIFDVISGSPQATIDQAVLNLHKKPATDRLDQALQDLSLDHRNLPIRLWGDQKQDVTQGAGLFARGVSNRVTGELVNPVYGNSSAQPETIEGITVSYRKSLV